MANLPEGKITNEIKYLEIKNKNKIGVIADLHDPYHSKEAIQITTSFFKKKKIDTLILAGDSVDFYSISRFDKIPTDINLQFEIDVTNQVLKYIRQELPKTEIYFMYGNHEFRLYNKMLRYPEIFNLNCLKLNKLLGLDELNIRLLELRQIIKYNDIFIIHGDEIPERKLKKPFQNIIYGHRHKKQINISEISLDNRQYISHGIGCLCALNPDYMPINDWNHGFGYIEDNQIFNYIIKNNRLFL